MMIEIRPVTTIEQCRQIGEIESAAWGADEVTPDHILLAIAQQKGAVLLAYDGGQPVGFCVSFVSFGGSSSNATGFRLKHHSHMAAVLPSHQGRGIAQQIKWAQRDFVLEQGIDWMTWTFDPLETRNGRLNIYKLGAVCCRYERDLYGAQVDELNMGIATDRFEVDWWLASLRVQAHRARQSANEMSTTKTWVVNQVSVVDGIRPERIQHDLFGRYDRLLVAVPTDFQAIKRVDLIQAVAWRKHTREIFETAFAQNYTVIDLLMGERLCHYVLIRDWRP